MAKATPSPKLDTDSLAKTFDWLADRYIAQTTQISMGWYPGWMRRVATFIESLEPRSVVDIGCGPGLLVQELLQHLPTTPLTAVDSSSQALSYVPPAATRVHADLHEFAASHREMFDVAVMSFVLRDIPGPRTVAAVASVLRPHGHLVVLETHTPTGWREPGFRLYFHHWLPWWGDRALTADWPGDRKKAPYRWLSETHRAWHRGEALPQWSVAAGLRNPTCHTRSDDVVMLWSAQR